MTIFACARCGEPVVGPGLPGTSECVRCWELRTRIESDPELAYEFLRELFDRHGTELVRRVRTHKRFRRDA